jgi:proteasome lid subunit RPN8/RPN11
VEFFRNDERVHLRDEEEELFPPLVRHVQSQPDLLREARVQHMQLAPPSVVWLRPEAYSTIVNWPHELGLECGGYLAGHESDGEIVIEAVFGAEGADPVGEPNRLVLSREWLDVVNDKVERAGWHVVGDCHTHVRAEPQLSETDERGLRGAADAMQQNWVGIVIGRDKDRVGWTHEWLWLKPELRGYLARPGARSVLPIQLIVEQEPA